MGTQNLAKAISLYESGVKTLRQLAEFYGIEESALRALFVERGVVIRRRVFRSKKRSRRSSADLSSDLKKAFSLRGEEPCCEVCRWIPPRRYYSILQAHHIVPVAAGGEDHLANLLLLCPNHHALAHAMFPMTKGIYRGPEERGGLMEALSSPDEYSLSIKRRLVASLR